MNSTPDFLDEIPMTKSITCTIFYLMVIFLFVQCSSGKKENGIEPEPDESKVRIRSIIPILALPGDTIVILGSDFGSTPSAIKVTFGDRNAQVVSSSDDKIEAIVPVRSESETSIVRVIVGKLTSNALLFRYKPDPVIESLSANAGAGGQNIDIIGSGFGSKVEGVSIIFDKRNASIVSISDKKITFTVPPFDGSNTVDIAVVIGQKTSNTVSFKYSSNSVTYTNPVFEPILADPGIIRGDNGMFYAYGTEDDWGDGQGTRPVPIVESRNLVDWKFVRNSFTWNSRPKWKTNGGVWAVDVAKVNGKYLMYYSFSIWNDPNPGIGVAEAATPAGPFTDIGKLFLTSEIGVPASIDPFYVEEGGKKYLFFGSYSTAANQGTYAVELTEDGRRIKDLNIKVKVAAGDFEAVTIHKRGEYFYFFGSRGHCCDGLNSTYNVRYGRSKNLLGPYIDKSGSDIRERGKGTLFINGVGNSKFVGPGHNAAIVTDDAGTDWFIYHAILRSTPYVSSGANRRSLMLDRITWVNGWPEIDGSTPSIGPQNGPHFQ
jgi:arabinan endo-1,5-alpha-L-arabinosidase